MACALHIIIGNIASNSRSTCVPPRIDDHKDVARVASRNLEILPLILLVILRVSVIYSQSVCQYFDFENKQIRPRNATQRDQVRRRDCREGLAAFNHDNFGRIATGRGRFSVVAFSKGLRPISTIIRDNKL